MSHMIRGDSRHSYQAMAVEGGVDTSEEEPARPQVLKAKLQDKINQENQDPHHHKLQEGISTETDTENH